MQCSIFIDNVFSYLKETQVDGLQSDDYGKFPIRGYGWPTFNKMVNSVFETHRDEVYCDERIYFANECVDFVDLTFMKIYGQDLVYEVRLKDGDSHWFDH